MLVTITTDASFHPELKYGAYAFWAVSNEFRITKIGVFKNKCINQHDAEAKCIINALKTVLIHKGITKIIINTDSLNAIALLEQNKALIKRYLGKDLARWEHIKKAYNDLFLEIKNKPNIEFRHVKAHTNCNDKRSFVNNWCDKNAKNELRKHIKN